VEIISVSNKAEVYDLTIDSDSDSGDSEVETLPFIPQREITSQGTTKLGPRGKEKQQNEGSSAISSFEEFHREQEKINHDRIRREAEMEKQREALVSNFVNTVRDMFNDISEAYLLKLLEELEPKHSSDGELVNACIEVIVSQKGQYPKASTKRKRPKDDEGGDNEGDGIDLESDDEAEGDSSTVAGQSEPKPKRDFKDYTQKMSPDYEYQW
jgi:hypothetical protein